MRTSEEQSEEEKTCMFFNCVGSLQARHWGQGRHASRRGHVGSCPKARGLGPCPRSGGSAGVAPHAAVRAAVGPGGGRGGEAGAPGARRAGRAGSRQGPAKGAGAQTATANRAGGAQAGTGGNRQGSPAVAGTCADLSKAGRQRDREQGRRWASSGLRPRADLLGR